MNREENGHSIYDDIARTISAHDDTVTDNVHVLNGIKWISINHTYCIETSLSVPRHQHHNYSEGVSDNFMFVILKLFLNTPHSALSY